MLRDCRASQRGMVSAALRERFNVERHEHTTERLGLAQELVTEFDEWLGVFDAAGSADNTGSI